MKNWVYNILLAAGVIAILVFLLFRFFGCYTKHGNQVEVPNVKGLRIDEAIAVLEKSGLKHVISDSVYSEEVKKMAIFDQDPASGNFVKEGRKIYLVVNSMSKPMVRMPLLVGKSFSLAKQILESAGLELGTVDEQYDEIGKNLVLKQMFRGDSIPFNKLIEKGSRINLVVSINKKNDQDTMLETPVPNPFEEDPIK